MKLFSAALWFVGWFWIQFWPNKKPESINGKVYLTYQICVLAEVCTKRSIFM